MKRWQSALLKSVLFCAGLVITFLPRRIELWLGARLGRFLMPFHSRRKVAFENAHRCFPSLDEKSVSKLIRQNYEHYGILALELLHLFSPFASHYRRYVLKNSRVIGLENWKRANDLGKGVLFVSSHLGNWEIMVGAGGLAGVPLTMVTKYLKPQWLHEKIASARSSVQVRGTYEPKTMPAVLRALRAGECVGFVMDQYAGPPIGVAVPFFGVKVGTLVAVGALAQRTGAAVVPVKTFRDSKGIVNISVEPLLDLGSILDDAEKTTAVLAEKIEGWVREYPSQWLWIHRRFKNVAWPAQMS